MAAILVVALLSVLGYYVLGRGLGNQQEVHIQIVGDVRDYFNPSNFTVEVGKPVTLVVFNGDDASHGLNIDEFNVNVSLPPNVTTRVTFTPTQTGTFRFYSPASSTNDKTGAQDLTGTFTVTS